MNRGVKVIMGRKNLSISGPETAGCLYPEKKWALTPELYILYQKIWVES